MQLHNRCNIGQDISGRFNAAADFFELVTKCHILVSAMSFFGMNDLDSEPSCNALPDGIAKWQKGHQGAFFSNLVGLMVDRYVIVLDFMPVVDTSGHTVYHPLESTSAFAENPHYNRIAHEHSYCNTDTESCRLPRRLEPRAGHHTLHVAQTDGVFL